MVVFACFAALQVTRQNRVLEIILFPSEAPVKAVERRVKEKKI